MSTSLWPPSIYLKVGTVHAFLLSLTAVDQRPVLSLFSPATPPIVAYPFVASYCDIPLSQMLGRGMPHKTSCRKGARRKLRTCVTSLCRGMAAQASYKPSVLIHSQMCLARICYASRSSPLLPSHLSSVFFVVEPSKVIFLI